MNISQPFTAPTEVLELEADARHKADDMRKDIVRVQKDPPLVAIGIPLCPLIIRMFQDSEMNNRNEKGSGGVCTEMGTFNIEFQHG